VLWGSPGAPDLPRQCRLAPQARTSPIAPPSRRLRGRKAGACGDAMRIGPAETSVRHASGRRCRDESVHDRPASEKPPAAGFSLGHGPRPARFCLRAPLSGGTTGKLENHPRVARNLDDGTQNLLGALRTSMERWRPHPREMHVGGGGGGRHPAHEWQAVSERPSKLHASERRPATHSRLLWTKGDKTEDSVSLVCGASARTLLHLPARASGVCLPTVREPVRREAEPRADAEPCCPWMSPHPPLTRCSFEEDCSRLMCLVLSLLAPCVALAHSAPIVD